MIKPLTATHPNLTPSQNIGTDSQRAPCTNLEGTRERKRVKSESNQHPHFPQRSNQQYGGRKAVKVRSFWDGPKWSKSQMAKGSQIGRMTTQRLQLNEEKEEKTEQSRKKTEQGVEPKRGQYLTYLEYAQIAEQELIKPSHFQKLALRNDLAKQETQSNNRILVKTNIKKERSTISRPTNNSSTTSQYPTIPSSQVGSLTKRTMDHMREAMKDQSRQQQYQAKSESSNDSYLNATSIKNFGLRPQKKGENRMQKIAICNLDKFASHFSKLLHKIHLEDEGRKSELEEAGRPELEEAGRPKFEFTDSYPSLEEGLLHFRDVYKSRKFTMIHKLDWRP